MDRKEFLNTGVFFGAAALVPGCVPGQKEGAAEPTLDEIADIPICCTHEHWGSIFNIGYRPEGFVADLIPGAMPSGKTTLVDLLLDPYLSGSLMGNGIDPQDFKEGQNKVKLFQQLKDFRLKGTYQSLRLGINFAYGYDIHAFDPDQLGSADTRIETQYQNMFSKHLQRCIRIRQ